MPLTQGETDFLAAYAYEYMRLEFGPANRKLKDRGFVYTDVFFLLDAYIRENPARIETVQNEAGNLVEELIHGRRNENPPDPPWLSREECNAATMKYWRNGTAKKHGKAMDDQGKIGDNETKRGLNALPDITGMS